MFTSKPHDLLRISGSDVLPADAPAWAVDALRSVPWVVLLPDALMHGREGLLQRNCQASESAQIVRAQFQAYVASASLRAAETPPAPFTGCRVVPSHSCTDETRIASCRETKL